MTVIKFAPGLKPVLKHQEHDQSTHGNWADGSQGSVSELSDDEIRDVIYNSKTVNEMFEKVAKRQGKSMKPSVDNLSENEITHYRGVQDVDRDAQRLLDGKIKFTEFQTWGQGIYLAEDKSLASEYGTLIGMKLDASAKIVQGETTWDSAFDVSYDNPSARTRNTTTSNFIDLGRIETQIRAGKMDNLSISDMRNVYWAAKGYDGFTTFGETVLFNGSKLTINRADIGTAVQKHGTGDQKPHGNWATSFFDRPEGYNGLDVPDGELPETVYHVTSSKNDEKISQTGLQVSAEDTWNIGASQSEKFEDGWIWGKGENGKWQKEQYRPNGVYVFRSLESAKQYAQTDSSIYAIDTKRTLSSGADVIRDPSSSENWDYMDDPEREQAWVFNNVPQNAVARLVLKHAQHNQQTHGNWATGGGGAGVDITGELDELFFNNKLDIKESKIFPGDLSIVARSEIARAGLNKKTVNLIDKMSEAQVASGQAYADNALKIIAERQGFTGKPATVKSVADLEKIQNAEGGTLVYRGIANYSAELNAYSPDKLDSFLYDYANRGIDIGSHPATYPAEQALIDFREGEYFGGWGVFGNGTYTTIKKDDADSYANTIDPERGVIGRGKTMAMLIPRTAKAPTKDVVKTVVKDMVYGGEPNHRNNVGRRLASLGYQYYDAGYVQDDKGGIFVVLDRSMITVAEKAVD